jgi:hypothetical protein
MRACRISSILLAISLKSRGNGVVGGVDYGRGRSWLAARVPASDYDAARQGWQHFHFAKVPGRESRGICALSNAYALEIPGSRKGPDQAVLTPALVRRNITHQMW